MRIVPAINCEDFDCVKSRAKQCLELFSAVDDAGQPQWMHFDVADGGFTNGYATWRNHQDLKELKVPANVKIEAHLMVRNPEAIFEQWLNAGASRIVVHLSATQNLENISSRCSESRAEVFLAFEPGSDIAHGFPYLNLVSGVQILAVGPGLSGQSFDPEALQKIKTLRKRFPSLIIEIDGGINPKTAVAAKEAGADFAVSGSYIFNSTDPARAFGELIDA